MGVAWTKTNCQLCLWGGCCRSLRLSRRDTCLMKALCAIVACWGKADDEVNHMARFTLHAVDCCMTKPVCLHEASDWQQRYISLLDDPVSRSWGATDKHHAHHTQSEVARGCRPTRTPYCTDGVFSRRSVSVSSKQHDPSASTSTVSCMPPNKSAAPLGPTAPASVPRGKDELLKVQ